MADDAPQDETEQTEDGARERQRRSRLKSVMGVDVGTINTRAVFFDIVNGTYRFISGNSASSTVVPPHSDATEGVRNAIEGISRIVGRQFIDRDDTLIQPTNLDEGTGVDVFGATASAGRPLKIILAGLMPDVSLESTYRIANTVYADVVDSLGLADRRSQARQIEAIRQSKPDIVLLSGGTEGGAEGAVLQLAETIALGCYLLEEAHRPLIVYAGNGAIRDKIEDVFEGITLVVMTTNLRPGLDRELLDPVRRTMSQTYNALRAHRVPGYHNLISWCRGQLTPTAQAFGYVARYLSTQPNYENGVLGIDIGAASTGVVAAIKGKLSVQTHVDLGLGENMRQVMRQTNLTDLTRWLPIKQSPSQIRDYVYNKMLSPQTIPQIEAELHIEQAAAREATRLAIARSQINWFEEMQTETSSLPQFDLIIGAGAVLGKAPYPGQAVLTLLDALQPTGISHVMIDSHNIASTLGSTALYTPLAMVQVLDSPDFAPTATVVSVGGKGKEGQTAISVKINPKSGRIIDADIPYGSIRLFEIPLGQPTQINLRPRRGFDIGGSGQNRSLTLTGYGKMGLIVDARGRPLTLPEDDATRLSLLRQWLKALRAPVSSDRKKKPARA